MIFRSEPDSAFSIFRSLFRAVRVGISPYSSGSNHTNLHCLHTSRETSFSGEGTSTVVIGVLHTGQGRPGCPTGADDHSPSTCSLAMRFRRIEELIARPPHDVQLQTTSRSALLRTKRLRQLGQESTITFRRAGIGNILEIFPHRIILTPLQCFQDNIR